MNLLPFCLAAESSEGFFARLWKWLIGLQDYRVGPNDQVHFRLLGLPEGWSLLLTVLAVAGLVWLTFWLYRREGRTVSVRRKRFLAVVRTLAILVVLGMFLEPALVLSRLHETPSPVLVLLDASESMTIDDLYDDPAEAAGVAAATGWDIGDVRGKRLKRQDILNAILANPKLAFLDRLAAKNPVHVYTFAGKPAKLRVPYLPPSPAPGEGGSAGAGGGGRPDPLQVRAEGGRTRMGRSMRSVMEDLGGQPLAAILVLGDGQDNDSVLDATASAAKLAEQEGVPVFGVLIGRPQSRRTKNIRVDKSLRANRTLFVGDPAEFVATVSSSGYGGVVELKADLYRQKVGSKKEEWLKSTNVSIGPDASGQPVSMTHTPLPGDEGEYTYTIKLSARSDEQLKRDNIAVASGIRVVKTTTNVLLIAGSPSWEFRRLRNLLIHDRNVVLSCWLQGTSRSYLQLGNRLLRRIPRRREIFDPENGYHVIVLMDIDPTDFDRQWFEDLREFVAEKAGGLLYIAGEKKRFTYHLLKSDIGRPLRAMLPVEFDLDLARMAVGSGPKGYREWPLRPTEDGLASPLLKFSTDREITQRIWKSLPGFVWTFPVQRAKPGATVLLRTMDRRRVITVDRQSRPMPVLVTGFYGTGRVAFLASDETWRWRRVPIRPPVYDTFWTQMIRSLIEGRLMGGRRSAILETDREQYPAGEPVTITAKVFDTAGKPARQPKARVKVEMTGADGGSASGVRPVWLELPQVKGTPGVYKAQYVPPRTGFYRLSLVGAGAGRAATVSIEVASQYEFDHPEANRVLMAELTSEKTGGGLVGLADLARLPDRIQSRTRRRIEPGGEFPLWSNPLCLGLLVLLLGVEWAVRKRSNLA